MIVADATWVALGSQTSECADPEVREEEGMGKMGNEVVICMFVITHAWVTVRPRVDGHSPANTRDIGCEEFS